MSFCSKIKKWYFGLKPEFIFVNYPSVNCFPLCVFSSGGSGEIECYNDIATFKRSTRCSSVMLARAAQWNPSIFFPALGGLQPIEDVVRKYVRLVRTHLIIFDVLVLGVVCERYIECLNHLYFSNSNADFVLCKYRIQIWIVSVEHQVTSLLVVHCCRLTACALKEPKKDWIALMFSFYMQCFKMYARVWQNLIF